MRSTTTSPGPFRLSFRVFTPRYGDRNAEVVETRRGVRTARISMHNDRRSSAPAPRSRAAKTIQRASVIRTDAAPPPQQHIHITVVVVVVVVGVVVMSAERAPTTVDSWPLLARASVPPTLRRN